jgi:hypothetical protein
MSANILQENLDLLLTEFGVGILNDNFIGAAGFVTGNPVVNSSTIQQVQILLTSDITLGVPSVETTTLDNFINTATLNEPMNEVA